ncbi:unnamed protein product [Mycena citricolor]|uniref:HMG domain-containing protein n=1 Tax=Mycena citricolor TaxID=2018698 RepID=A0AAD2GW36_9AGAR|nr:unnamed protein product [Mycena citricolor]
MDTDEYSDNEPIVLGLPPPSPPALIDLSSAFQSPSHVTQTPSRKRRRVEQEPRKPRAAPILSYDIDEPESESELGVFWNQAADDLLRGSQPGWNTPSRARLHLEEITSSNSDNDNNTSTADTAGYSVFCELILEDRGAFFQITRDLFVSNGWDPERKSLKRSVIGDAEVIVCQCPLARVNDNGVCVHTRFLQEEGHEHFSDGGVNEEDALDAILFSRQETGDDTWLNIFSCRPQASSTLNSRVIVQHTGENARGGSWSCSKDIGMGSCVHIHKCRDLLQQLIITDPEARYEVQDRTVNDTVHWNHLNYRRGATVQRAVSYLPVHAPPWATLPSDPVLYQHSKPAPPPSLLPLNDTSSCSCAQPRQRFQSHIPRISQSCTVYGLSLSWTTTIELQKCPNPRCSHRLVGPDCREFRIFNYNNQRLFTHEVLDEYTSAYTSSETPFSAWVSVVSRRYSLNDSTNPFPSADTFRSAWFLYVALQHLDDSMTCPRCGPSPETTIWDGVTLAFNKKHLLPTLEPPTVSQPSSHERHTTRYLGNQQLLSTAKLRRSIRTVLTGPPLTKTELDKILSSIPTAESEDEEEDEDNEDEANAAPVLNPRGKKALEKARKAFADRVDMLPVVVEGLERVDEALARLFNKQFGEHTVLNARPAPDVYRRFFIQIAAEESVLQFATHSALDALQKFVDRPSLSTGSALTEIPAIHELISHERHISDDLHLISQWLLWRGRAIYNALVKEPVNLPTVQSGDEKPWAETGCHYGLPKIRDRPRYPKLKYDASNEVGGKRGAKCSKFYSQYGERRLTGGIMCVWCTHSVCYGFHCIPKGEGRNDVFSALITRWETAPKRVIYDFACALGPYCMTREPTFFANTQFLIDDFHSVGHTKCSEAAFLKTYCRVDPRLSRINSSAGECGNSGLGRIRKSVSYMSQSRAILYTRVFLCIWNRLRIRKLTGCK